MPATLSLPTSFTQTSTPEVNAAKALANKNYKKINPRYSTWGLFTYQKGEK
jgi:hypothetical protein